MPNDLSIHDISTVLNEVIHQATGVAPTAPITTANFVTVAQTALLTGYDPLNTAISQVLAKTLFSARPYSAKFKKLRVNNQTYGNHVRKIQLVDKDWEEDASRFGLVDGQSVDHYRIRKPEAVQTNFYGFEPYKRHTTVFKDQWDTAWTGLQQAGEFISMIMSNASDIIEQCYEAMSRMTLNNLSVATYAANRAPQKHNVLALYNEFTRTATPLTMADIFSPDNYPNFVRWLYSHINTVSNNLTERTVTFHQQIGGKNIMRHTPKSAQILYLQAAFENQMSSIVTSTTYHDQRTAFPPHEMVNFWQNIEDPMSVSLDASTLDSSGNVTNTGETTIPILVGVLFDREAAGVSTFDPWSATTPLNADGGYWNYYWHFKERYWNDFSENAVIFYMEDTP